MAIEIILRDDISAYEPKPMYGFTYRQAVTIAIIVIVGFIVGSKLLSTIGDYKTMGSILVLQSCVIGAIGFVKFRGLHLEQYFSCALQDFLVPSHVVYEMPIVESETDKALARLKAHMTRKERKRALKETEGDDL